MSRYKKGKYAQHREEIERLNSQKLPSHKIAEKLESDTGLQFSPRKVREALQAWREEDIICNKQDTITSPNDYKKPIVFSSVDSEGKNMSIDEYCEVHNLPREDVSSFKLITHTGTPYYNIVFRENTMSEVLDFKDAIDSVFDGGEIPSIVPLPNPTEEVTRLIYTDTHIAMCTDEEGTAMYASPWNAKILMETLDYMCEEVLRNRVGNTLYIDDLGDTLDGWDAKTTRGGHTLPQNMSSQEAFKVALEFKIAMVRKLSQYFDTIVCHNVSVDNHGGAFSMMLNHAFKRYMEGFEGCKVVIVNIGQFMGHYFIGQHCFILCHGKDHKSLKFGFKPKLDPVQIEKIDHYMKHNEAGSIYKMADTVWFDKGDSHQMLFDYSTAQDFNYMNYPALSPASEWIQTNFKKGDRGFVIQQVDPNNKNVKLIPIII